LMWTAARRATFAPIIICWRFWREEGVKKVGYGNVIS
jgi:hypothetical protein